MKIKKINLNNTGIIKKQKINFKEIIFYILIIIFLVLLWISQKPRLDAYNDCYMAKYQDWSFPCELGYRGH